MKYLIFHEEKQCKNIQDLSAAVMIGALKVNATENTYEVPFITLPKNYSKHHLNMMLNS